MQPVGAPGEICIGGPGLARGYLNLPSLTAQKFANSTIANDNASATHPLYKTGDHAVRLEDGSLKFLGRKDHQIKIRGFRIELSEIEKFIARCESVDSTVVTVQDESQKLIAYLVSTSNDEQKKTQTVRAIKKSLSVNLPKYMMPSAFIFIDEWPLNSAGKINRNQLPKPEGYQFSEELIPPSSELELSICRVWSEVLGIPESDIGINSDFFELGGHSLLLTRVTSEIRKVFTIELSMRELFENSQLLEFAEYLDQKILDSENNKQRYKEATSAKASQTEELVI